MFPNMQNALLWGGVCWWIEREKSPSSWGVTILDVRLFAKSQCFLAHSCLFKTHQKHIWTPQNIQFLVKILPFWMLKSPCLWPMVASSGQLFTDSTSCGGVGLMGLGLAGWISDKRRKSKKYRYYGNNGKSLFLMGNSTINGHCQ